MDKLQTPQSFGQSVQELVIALQRTGDPGGLASLRSQLDCLTGIDPSPESETPDWGQVTSSLLAAKDVVAGLVNFCSLMGHRRSGEGAAGHVARYKTSLCRDLATHGSCPRGQNCTFAHSQSELEMHRNGAKKMKPKEGWTGREGTGSTDGDFEDRRQEEEVKREVESQIREVKPRINKIQTEGPGSPSVSTLRSPLPRDSKLVSLKKFKGLSVSLIQHPQVAALGPPPVAQVAPIPRVLQVYFSNSWTKSITLKSPCLSNMKNKI